MFCRKGGLRPATLLRKRLWHRWFSCEFCEISRNTFFYRTPLVAASVDNNRFFEMTITSKDNSKHQCNSHFTAIAPARS